MLTGAEKEMEKDSCSVTPTVSSFAERDAEDERISKCRTIVHETKPDLEGKVYNMEFLNRIKDVILESVVWTLFLFMFCPA